MRGERQRAEGVTLLEGLQCLSVDMKSTHLKKLNTVHQESNLEKIWYCQYIYQSYIHLLHADNCVITDKILSAEQLLELYLFNYQN